MSDSEQCTCMPPQRDPADRSSWSARRWDCPECDTRWIYVRRMIGRKIRGEWCRMPGQPSEIDRLRARVAELEAAGDRFAVAAEHVSSDINSKHEFLSEILDDEIHRWRVVRGTFAGGEREEGSE